MRILVFLLSFFLAFSASAQKRPDQQPEKTPTANDAIYTQEDPAGVIRKIKFYKAREYFGSKVLSGCIPSVPPSLDPSSVYKGFFVTHCTTNDVYYVDGDGRRITIKSAAALVPGTGIHIVGDVISAADPSATNEIQTLTYSAGNLTISGGNTVVIPAGEATTVSDGTTIDLTLTGTAITAEVKDGTITPAKLDRTYLETIPSTVATDAEVAAAIAADSALDLDKNPTNEIQTLTYSAGNLTISGGNTVVIPPGEATTVTNTATITNAGTLPNLTLNVNDGSISSAKITDGTLGVVDIAPALMDSIQKINWRLLGNAGTNPALNYVGTSDAVDMVLQGNARKWRFGSNNIYDPADISVSKGVGYGLGHLQTGSSFAGGAGYQLGFQNTGDYFAGGAGYQLGQQNSGYLFAGGAGYQLGFQNTAVFFAGGAGAQLGYQNTGTSFAGGAGYQLGYQNTGANFAGGAGTLLGYQNTGTNFAGGAGAQLGYQNTGNAFCGLGANTGVANRGDDVVLIGENIATPLSISYTALLSDVTAGVITGTTAANIISVGGLVPGNYIPVNFTGFGTVRLLVVGATLTGAPALVANTSYQIPVKYNNVIAIGSDLVYTKANQANLGNVLTTEVRLAQKYAFNTAPTLSGADNGKVFAYNSGTSQFDLSVISSLPTASTSNQIPVSTAAGTTYTARTISANTAIDRTGANVTIDATDVRVGWNPSALSAWSGTLPITNTNIVLAGKDNTNNLNIRVDPLTLKNVIDYAGVNGTDYALVSASTHTPDVQSCVEYDADANAITVTIGTGLPEGKTVIFKARRNTTNNIVFNRAGAVVFSEDGNTTVATTTYTAGVAECIRMTRFGNVVIIDK